MNNAWLPEEGGTKVEFPPEEKNRLIKIIEAIDVLYKREEWRTLEELLFKKEEERIKRLLLSESLKPQIDPTKIHVLQGELKWARRYSDILKLAKVIKNQLDKLK